MESKLMYVELKTGFSDNGPAWIGKAFFSKSGRTIYFNGLAFKKSEGVLGNYVEKLSKSEYWVSGVNKKGNDRRLNATGEIQIDKSVIEEYLTLIKATELPKNKFAIAELNNTPIAQFYNETEKED